jgi:hypothetical protein
MPMVLSITHRRVKAVDTIAVVHLPICNKWEKNKTLTMRRYSARLTRHNKNKMTPRNYEGLYSGVADSFAKTFLAFKESFPKALF